MPNDDLISRKALLNGFDVHWVTEFDEAGFGMEYKAVPVGAIENAPAVDAEPVRHATWSKNISREFVFCSACNDSSFGRGCFAFPNKPEIINWRYCPHCGAKMHLEEDTPCTQQ